jgi:hypothetical protein
MFLFQTTSTSSSLFIFGTNAFGSANGISVCYVPPGPERKEMNVISNNIQLQRDNVATKKNELKQEEKVTLKEAENKLAAYNEEKYKGPLGGDKDEYIAVHNPVVEARKKLTETEQKWNKIVGKQGMLNKDQKTVRETELKTAQNELNAAEKAEDKYVDIPRFYKLSKAVDQSRTQVVKMKKELNELQADLTKVETKLTVMGNNQAVKFEIKPKKSFDLSNPALSIDYLKDKIKNDQISIVLHGLNEENNLNSKEYVVLLNLLQNKKTADKINGIVEFYAEKFPHQKKEVQASSALSYKDINKMMAEMLKAEVYYAIHTNIAWTPTDTKDAKMTAYANKPEAMANYKNLQNQYQQHKQELETKQSDIKIRINPATK